MPQDEAALYALLPEASAMALRRAASEADASKAAEHVVAALTAVGFPEAGRPAVFPLPSLLTPSQRAVAELLAYREQYIPDGFGAFAIPKTRRNRRHWLGLDGVTALHHPVSFKERGSERTEPLWRAIQIGASKVLANVPVDVAARALAELWQELTYPWYTAFADNTDREYYAFDKVHPRLKAEAKPWIVAYADQVLAMAKTQGRKIPLPVKWITFLSLVRAGVPIEPRWDVLFPIEARVRMKLTLECLRAIPPERRSAAILNALVTGGLPFYNVPVALRLLEDTPTKELAAWIAQHADQAEHMTKREVLAAVAKVESADTRAVHAAATKGLRPLKKLTYKKLLAPTRVEQLGALQQKQLQAAGKAYDGQNLPASARLEKSAGEGPSFRGFLELGHLVDDKGTVVYDTFLYMVDSGSIFKTGTTTRVAAIIQSGVECKSEALTEALEQAFADRSRAEKKAAKGAAPGRAKKAPAAKRAKRAHPKSKSRGRK